MKDREREKERYREIREIKRDDCLDESSKLGILIKIVVGLMKNRCDGDVIRAGQQKYQMTIRILFMMSAII